MQNDPDKPLQKGEIVQLGPNTANPAFKFCLMVVTEPKSFGAVGYVPMVGRSRDEAGGHCYYREEFAKFERTGGVAPWVVRQD
jgi:hypothetical protein